MKRFIGFLVFLVFVSTVFFPAIHLPGYENGAVVHGSGPADTLNTILSSYTNYDINRDGTFEINSLSPLSFESYDDPIMSNERMMVVLVEPRLLQYIPGSPYNENELLNRLETFKTDLRAEGYRTRFVAASVYSGPEHQDGQTVLAIREFFKSVKTYYPAFEGAILVGSFPEAQLVRRWLWKRPSDSGQQIGGYTYPQGTPYLNLCPEIIAGRAELVLADLDGNWSNLYRKSVNIDCFQGMPNSAAGTNWPVAGGTIGFERVNSTVNSFTDVFFIQDDDWTILNNDPAAFSIRVNATAQRNPEIAPADASLPNPLARPDIYVSRINARNIATNPDANYTDIYGQKYLDANGKPQTVQAAGTINLTIGSFWFRDPKLERKILIDYFDRNHTYRVGKYNDLPFRTASIAYGDGLRVSTPDSILNQASSQFAPSVTKADATLVDFVNWLKNPAILKGIEAHSSAWNSGFGSNFTATDLQNACGGVNAWRWVQDPGTFIYRPSYANWDGTADQYLFRTIWESKILAGAGPNLFLHLGCDVNTPGFADTMSYTFDHYGEFQNAEGVMFYLNGLALMSRAKGFYDAPGNFGAAYAASERTGFGSGWKRYFDDESQDSVLATVYSDNKRVYPWSVIGDWTLRKRYAGGIAILGCNSAISSLAIGANESWLNYWNFSAVSTQVAGIGDLDGDTADEFLLTSDWGLGIIRKYSAGFKSAAVYTNDTWLGNWRYNASVNPGKDKILGVGDFNGDGKREILIQSSWGMGILAWNGSALTSLYTVPSGTLLSGGWRTSSVDNTIRAIADLNGDGKDEILLTSPWGYGVLQYNGSLISLVCKPNGTMFGGWYSNSNVDKVGTVGNFDSDYNREVLVTSGSGMAILKMSGNTFTAINIVNNNTSLGSWVYNSTRDKIQGAGDFNRDRVDEILITNSSGLGILKVAPGSITAIVNKPNGTWFGGWNLDTNNNVFQGISELNGDGAAELLITSPWGIGTLKLSADTMTTIAVYPYKSKLGDWILTSTNKVKGIGHFSGGPTPMQVLMFAQ